MPTLLKGKVGSHGKMVHIIEAYEPGTEWGYAPCGWGGKVTLTNDLITCPTCKMILDKGAEHEQ